MSFDRSGAVGLVVPVFDEASRVEEFLPELLAFLADLPEGSQLVVVDDGSSDETAALVEAHLAASSPNASLLRRPHRGKGAAVSAGLAAVDTPVRAFCDLDLSTPLDDLGRIIRAGSRPGTLAIGSRDLVGSTLVRPEGRLREALGRTYNRLLQASVTPGVVDTQCGAKAATAAVWGDVLAHCRQQGFAWDAELIAVAGALGVQVEEIPVSWRHDDRSKVRVWHDGPKMVLSTPAIARSRRAARLAGRPSTASEVFDDLNAQRLLESDRTHWWFRSKAALVATALQRTGGRGGPGRLVDAGAGAGGVTALLGWRPDDVVILEGSAELARSAAARHGFASVCSLVEPLPLADGSAQVVCLLDVIEHVEDPVSALREAWRCLAPGGRLVVNVPAHAWLWSEADVELGHLRRYTRRMLRDQLEEAGIEGPRLLTHVFSWLVPPVLVVRRMGRGGGAELGLDRSSPLLDRAALVLTWIERMVLGRVALPFGTSVLAVVEKAAEPAGLAADQASVAR